MLLVSSDFLASEFINNVELKIALERHQKKEARVIPVILRPCDWEETRIGELHTLPKNGKPVVAWRIRDHAFNEVTKGIRKVVKDAAGHQPVSPDSDTILIIKPAPKLAYDRMIHIILLFAIIFVCLTFNVIIFYRGAFSPWTISLDAAQTGASIFASIMYSRSSKGKQIAFYVIGVFLNVLLIINSLGLPGYAVSSSPPPGAYSYCSDTQIQSGQPRSPGSNGIGVIRKTDGNYIGISDGSFAFDTNTAPTIDFNSQEITKKCQAVEQLATGDSTGMMLSLMAALKIQPNDAEAQIYLEDQKVLASKKPYVTVVVTTTLTGSDLGKVGVGRDTLRGVNTAQLEYNNNTSHTLQVLVLIANAGSDPKNVTPVAQQIIQLSKSDPTFIGVIGWSFSSYAAIEIPLLNAAHIPMISPTATADNLTSTSPYFFRITPTNQKEAIIGANYIHTILQPKCILLLHGNDIFSQNLATDFNGIYTAHGYGYISEQQYKDNDTNAFNDLHNWLSQGRCSPDLIYFAGDTPDLNALAKQLNQMGRYSLKIAGGDSLYDVGFPYTTKVYSHLLFTAAASPDVWKNKRLPEPPFYSEYAQNFDPHNTHLGIYGWSRADADSILSYDALLALLDGYAKALIGHPHSTLQDVEQSLQKITPFQGASGLVSLQDDNGNPSSGVNKVIVMLTVDQNGDTHPQQVYGCLTQDHCYP